MKKHIYLIDQEEAEYLLPETHSPDLFGPKNPDLVRVEFYAQQWYREAHFHTLDIERACDILRSMACSVHVENIQEYFKQKYMQWVQKWSIPYSDIPFDSAYELNKSLRYHAFPWVINFELTKLLMGVQADLKYKNLAMGMIRSEVAYAIKAVPGD